MIRLVGVLLFVCLAQAAAAQEKLEPVGTIRVGTFAKTEPDGTRTCALKFTGLSPGQYRGADATYGYLVQLGIAELNDEMTASIYMQMNRITLLGDEPVYTPSRAQKLLIRGPSGREIVAKLLPSDPTDGPDESDFMLVVDPILGLVISEIVDAAEVILIASGNDMPPVTLEVDLDIVDIRTGGEIVRSREPIDQFMGCLEALK